MKIINFVAAVALAAMTVSSCGMFGKASTSSTASAETNVSATANGQAAGVALNALYTQYKADGRMDMSNMTNLLNLATLASNVQGLKGQSDKSTFYKQFAAGLILGSNNLVTENTSEKVMSGLTDLVNNIDLSGLQQKAENASEKVSNAAATASIAVENATTIANSVSNILNLFKK